MSYNYLTQYNSPNYTSAAATPGMYRMPRVIEGITIHHWGDPNQNPQFLSVVNYLCRANGNTSAHYVATGTNRQVACIVNPGDTAWHSGSTWGNARTIGIELDPRARPEDYDVAAELIADIRSAYGDVPLYEHSYFTATACPGAYDHFKLDALSYTKYSHAIGWGKGGNKVATPAPAPVPQTKAVPDAVKLPEPITLVANLDKVHVWDLATNPNYKSTKTLSKGETFRAYASIAFNGTTYYQTEYSFGKKNKTGVNIVDMKKVAATPPQQEPSPTTGQPDSGKPVVDKDDYEETKARLFALEAIVKTITDFLSTLFTNYKK